VDVIYAAMVMPILKSVSIILMVEFLLQYRALWWLASCHHST